MKKRLAQIAISLPSFPVLEAHLRNSYYDKMRII